MVHGYTCNKNISIAHKTDGVVFLKTGSTVPSVVSFQSNMQICWILYKHTMTVQNAFFQLPVTLEC